MSVEIKITNGPSVRQLFLALELGVSEKRKTTFELTFMGTPFEVDVPVRGIKANDWNDEHSWEIVISIPKKIVEPQFTHGETRGVVATYSTKTRKGVMSIDLNT